jgi:hypothetical protein
VVVCQYDKVWLSVWTHLLVVLIVCMVSIDHQKSKQMEVPSEGRHNESSGQGLRVPEGGGRRRVVGALIACWSRVPQRMSCLSRDVLMSSHYIFVIINNLMNCLFFSYHMIMALI